MAEQLDNEGFFQLIRRSRAGQRHLTVRAAAERKASNWIDYCMNPKCYSKRLERFCSVCGRPNSPPKLRHECFDFE